MSDLFSWLGHFIIKRIYITTFCSALVHSFDISLSKYQLIVGY